LNYTFIKEYEEDFNQFLIVKKIEPKRKKEEIIEQNINKEEVNYIG